MDGIEDKIKTAILTARRARREQKEAQAECDRLKNELAAANEKVQAAYKDWECAYSVLYDAACEAEIA